MRKQTDVQLSGLLRSKGKSWRHRVLAGIWWQVGPPFAVANNFVSFAHNFFAFYIFFFGFSIIGLSGCGKVESSITGETNPNTDQDNQRQETNTGASQSVSDSVSVNPVDESLVLPIGDPISVPSPNSNPNEPGEVAANPDQSNEQTGKRIEREIIFQELVPNALNENPIHLPHSKRLSDLLDGTPIYSNIDSSEISEGFPIVEIFPDSYMKAFTSSYQEEVTRLGDLKAEDFFQKILNTANISYQLPSDEASRLVNDYKKLDLKNAKLRFSLMNRIFLANIVAKIDVRYAYETAIQLSNDSVESDLNKSACYVSMIQEMVSNPDYVPAFKQNQQPNLDQIEFAKRFSKMGEFCAATTVLFKDAFTQIHRLNTEFVEGRFLTDQQEITLAFELVTQDQAVIRATTFLRALHFLHDESIGPLRGPNESISLALRISRRPSAFDTYERLRMDFGSQNVVTKEANYLAYISAIMKNQLSD